MAFSGTAALCDTSYRFDVMGSQQLVVRDVPQHDAFAVLTVNAASAYFFLTESFTFVVLTDVSLRFESIYQTTGSGWYPIFSIIASK
jgi:hypothetical protein